MTERLAASFLELGRGDLAAARRLLPAMPRHAAFHLQQAAEKLIKAALAAAGVFPVPRSHAIGYLLGLLPPGHELANLAPALANLTPFAAVIRYPEGGALVPLLDPDELHRRADLIEALLAATPRPDGR